MPVTMISPEVIVCRVMSLSGLFDHHIVPRYQTINQEYYWNIFFGEKPAEMNGENLVGRICVYLYANLCLTSPE